MSFPIPFADQVGRVTPPEQTLFEPPSDVVDPAGRDPRRRGAVTAETLLEGLNEPQRAAVTHAGTPLLVAEFGIGTDDDQVRAAYLQRGLDVVHQAIERGVDVRGLFHWTAVDNY